ncbi:hypothetical protein [Paramicrobacterium chengjingii]|nr:hypothetical protein [Microbacterium chengjingii]
MTDDTQNISALLRTEAEAEAAEANPDAPANAGTKITRRGRSSRV